MRPRWDQTRRYWDAIHVRWQSAYSLDMKRLGPAAIAFSQTYVSRLRAEHRKLLRQGVRAERLVLSEFRARRRFLPKDRKSR